MKFYRAVFLFLFAYLSFVPSVNGQQQKQQVYFDKYDVKSGLPESSVNSIQEDWQGYIWMATQNGLVRYDGYNYKVYNLGDKKINLDPISNVRGLYLDKKHTLWATTSSNGLFKYNPISDTFIQFVYPEKDLAIIYTILTDDNAGNLWGRVDKDDEKNYLWKLDEKGHFEFFGKKFTKVNYIDASRIYSAFTSTSGKVWFGTNNGIYSYEGKNIPLKGYLKTTNIEQSKEVVYLYEPPSEPGVFWMVAFHGKFKDTKIVRFDAKLKTYKELIPKPDFFNYTSAQRITINRHFIKFYKSIFEDKQKQLWVAGYDGMVRLNRETHIFDYFKTGFKYEKVSEMEWIFDITATKEGPFWLSSPGGLVQFDPKTKQFDRYLPDPDRPGAVLTDRNILSKTIDHTGTFWLGFAWAGANKSNRIKSAFRIYYNNPKQFDSYPKEGGFFASGENGYNWFVSRIAIYRWEQKGKSFVKIYSADPNDPFIGNGCLTKEGDFYISTIRNLLFYNHITGKKEKFATDKVIQGENLYFPFEDANGIVWLSTNGKGICSFNPITKKFKLYPYRKNGEKITSQNVGSLDNSDVTSTFIDRQHRFWVGTNEGSLNLYDPIKDSFVSYFNSKDKSMRCITKIYEDTSGRLWVGTYQNGLFEFDRKKGKWIRHLNEASGLLFNGVFGINEDAAGQLWVTTERGLSRIDPKNLSVKNFPLNTILTGYDFSLYGVNLFKLDNGHFITPLSNGYAEFNPKDLDANRFPPKVHLEKLIYSNPREEIRDESVIVAFGRNALELPYNQNRIRFDYVGLQFDNPSENNYAYKLNGYDEGWVQAGSQRTVTYTNLSPGTYTFNLKAANSDGVWSKAKSTITIIISKPWWLTWWAYLIYFVVFISLLRIYVVFRARNLKRENRVLEEKVNHRTNQLTKSIEELKITQSQLIQSEKMASLGELTAGIAHEIQNPLNFVNNFSEVNQEMVEEASEEIDKENYDEVKIILKNIKDNSEKINHHGKRADAIVKGMLQHSRNSAGSKEPTDINKLADEYLRLAYHGLRAKDKNFNVTLKTDFDETIGTIYVVKQDIERVILNLITNAFYSTNEKHTQAVNVLTQAETDEETYVPTVTVSTKIIGNTVEVSVKDNGNGIPQNVIDKIFQPFFTTKPTGQGTGLGLSMSYDIVKAHGGELRVESKVGVGSEFVIALTL